MHIGCSKHAVTHLIHQVYAGCNIGAFLEVPEFNFYINFFVYVNIAGDFLVGNGANSM